VGTTATSLLGGIQIFVNGIASGPSRTLIAAADVLITQTFVQVTAAPVVVQVRATGLTLSVAANSTNIIIERLGS
jgi:hypothetical protein